MLRLPRSHLTATFVACACVVTTLPAQERTLTSTVEIRSLSVEEANRAYPVKLRGVVVFIDTPIALFLQDEGSSVFFRTLQRPLPEVGDEIEIEGYTRMGLFLPGVGESSFRLIGRRELPPGEPVQYDDLYFGRYHYQRVTVTGIVRSVTAADEELSVIRLAEGSRIIEARVGASLDPTRPLVGHRVRVTGLAAGLINSARRQLVKPQLRVLGWHEVEILTAGPNVEEVPFVSAEELLAFRVTGLGDQRVRMEGVVTAAFGGDQVFLQQGAHAFEVRFSSAVDVVPGDRLTVAGFPSMERFSASVVDAQLLDRVSGPVLEPLPVVSTADLYGTIRDPQSGRYDGHMVRLSGTVRAAFRNEEGFTLVVQDNERTIDVRVPPDTMIPPDGSFVRIAGICYVETAVRGSGFASRPGIVSLRSPHANDVEVVRTPPWWTPRRLAVGIAALAGVTILAGLWIAVLRRQVRRQTSALRTRIETTAVHEERQRIAREFHDTLEQELAGVSLRLDALCTRISDEKTQGLASVSRHLISRIQCETRDLISDLRDTAEAAGDLVSVLDAVTARYGTESCPRVRLKAVGTIPRLMPAVVHDLRMIAREAVNNARKHSGAVEITIEVLLEMDVLVMRVVDDGCGFDASTSFERKLGRFGCAGMRERARKLGVAITWKSEPAKGTIVEVKLPVEKVEWKSARGESPRAADPRPLTSPSQVS